MDHKLHSASLSYTLFLYREQLGHSMRHEMRLNHTKITLTEKLIRKTQDNCTLEDMLAINRGIMLKQKLKYQNHRMRRMKRAAEREQRKRRENM